MPHDWLLPQCSAAIHHGGAGTTAASLLWECPTTVVYFFGDQPFWGMACHKCAGPPGVCVSLRTELRIRMRNSSMARDPLSAPRHHPDISCASSVHAELRKEVFRVRRRNLISAV